MGPVLWCPRLSLGVPSCPPVSRGQAGSVRGAGTAACLGLHPPDRGRQRDERGATAAWLAQSDPKTLLSTSPKEPRGRGTLPGLKKPPPRARLLDTRPGPRMRTACPAHGGAREGPRPVGAMPGAGSRIWGRATRLPRLEDSKNALCSSCPTTSSKGEEKLQHRELLRGSPTPQSHAEHTTSPSRHRGDNQ